MKKPFRLFSLLLAACVIAASFPQAGFAAEGSGTTHTVSDNQSVSDLLRSGTVKDGDTIQITGTGYVQPPVVGQQGSDTPWVINKAVTITGGILSIQAGGIILGADVTFKDISLSFSSNVRNAVIANGHTLTLENVTCDNHSFNLFCGGLINSNRESFTDEMPAPGNLGTIYIRGNTSLQKVNTYGSGNIYAGNLCMGGMDGAHNGANDNGPANVFNGDAVITIEGSSSNLGAVYACGGQQRIPVGQPNGKETTPNAAAYTVSGTVTVSGNVPDVEGAGSQRTDVTYQGDGNMDTIGLYNISSLSVETGKLQLKAGSRFREGNTVRVNSGAKLVLSALAGSIPTFGDFAGGGFLVLQQNQTLSISGTVAGTTSVAIGDASYNNTYSTALPVAGHCYIQAPNSKDGAFRLLPYANQPDMALVRDENGDWEVPAKEAEDAKLESLAPENVWVASGILEVIVPLNTTYSGEAIGLDTLPLTIRVNSNTAQFVEEDAYTKYYKANDLCIFVSDTEDGGGKLFIYAAKINDPIPEKAYLIEIVVPKEYTVSGEELCASCTLTVGDATAEPISIPVPQAKTGLVWTGAELTGVEPGVGYTLTGNKASDAGSYTAAASLRDGYQWEGGSREDKSIPWSIAKSTTPPAAPGGLAGTAPTSDGGADGKITGTTAEMEYSTDSGFSAPQSCGAGETAGLAAGPYYVRLKDNGNHVAGAAAEVIVPAYGAPDPDPEPGHQHSWSATWSTSATHHWHNCTGENCPIQQDSEKEGYTSHTAGDWVVDQAATSTQSGSRHRSCRVCGYEMVRETIPATGGGSSGGGSSGGSSSGGGSSGGGSSTSTVKNPNGSTTTTTVNKGTGTVTETTRNTDGSTLTVETQKSGVVITTEKAADGSTVKTTADPDGSLQTAVKRSDGTTASASTDRRGATEAQVSLSKGAVSAAHKDNRPAALPIPAVNAGGIASRVEISLPANSGAVRVEIPVKNTLPGSVAVIVNPDGSESVVKKAFAAEDGMVLTLNGTATVKIVDKSMDFTDVSDESWAAGAIDFVSARDMFQGTGGGAFFPENAMTRGMLAMVLYSLEDSPAHSGGNIFTDVEETWYNGAIHWAAEQGIVSGYSGGQFGPNDNITREQFAVILWRYAGNPAATDKELNFADAGQASGYALEALRWARENDIINGDGSGQLMPQGQATRAQAAQILMNFIQKQGNNA